MKHIWLFIDAYMDDRRIAKTKKMAFATFYYLYVMYVLDHQGAMIQKTSSDISNYVVKNWYQNTHVLSSK